MTDDAKDALAGLSIANVVFVQTWAVVLNLDARNSYYARITDWDLVGLIGAVVLLGAVLSVLLRLTRRVGSPWVGVVAGLALIGTLLIPLNFLRVEATDVGVADLLRWMSTPHLAVVSLLVLAAVLVPMVRRPESMIRGLRTGALVISPFVLATTGQAVWMLASDRIDASFEDPPSPPPRSPGARGSQVVVLVFDELDQRVAFDARPETVDLPNLDSLRRRSVVLAAARQAADRTSIAIPSLTTGLALDNVLPRGPDRLLLVTRGSSDTLAWSHTPNLFSNARSSGADIGVVGFGHPYCRVFGDVLTRCFWRPHDALSLGAAGPIRALLDRFHALSPWNRRRQHLVNYREMLHAAESMLEDPRLDVVYLHLPVPHLPAIYSKRRERLTRFNHDRLGYLDNLVLADHTLGRLKNATAGSVPWDERTIVLTADHSWRGSEAYDGRSDDRVPLLVRLPGQRDSILVGRPQSARILAPLISALVGGTLSLPAQITDFLTR